MRTTKLIPLAAALMAGLLLAGCSAEAEPTGASGGDAPTTANVDKAALDTGDYPTTPAPPYGYADPASAGSIEGQRLSEFTTLPYEIDADLTDVKMPTGPLKDGGAVSMLISGNASQVTLDNGMMTGFSTVASTPGRDNSRSVLHAVLRFGDNAAATAAAEGIYQGLLTEDSGMGLPVPENIDVLPNTKVTVHDIPDLKKVDVNALTVHGDYIIYTWASAPTDQKDWTAKSVAKALQLQEPLLDKFPATPKDKTKELKIDQNDLLIYAVPNKEGDARQTSQMAVYGPRGMAHRSTNPQLTYEVLTGAGVEHAASYNTSVYRAASADDAITVLDAFVDDLTAAGFAAAPAPAGLPDAKCLAKDTTSGEENYCYVVNGRYMGEAGGLDKKDVDQQIAAQYLILEQADQDAE